MMMTGAMGWDDADGGEKNDRLSYTKWTDQRRQRRRRRRPPRTEPALCCWDDDMLGWDWVGLGLRDLFDGRVIVIEYG